MRCPVCNYHDTKVVDSRLIGGGTSIRRRRECGKCGHRFSTVEDIELLDLTVVKRDGRREAYSREKLDAGLRRALEKRSHTAEDFRGLVGVIERDLQRKKRREITSKEIGEMVMDRLRAFDKVAYIRFASVYRQFEDVETFVKELEALKKKKHPAKSKHKTRTK